MLKRQNSGLRIVFRLIVRTFVATALLLACPALTSAAIYYWSAASGDWSGTNPSPWNLGIEPASSDPVYIQNDGTATITQLGEACSDLHLGTAGTGKSGTIQMTGGSLAVLSDCFVGGTGTGTFSQSGGTNTISSNLYLGWLSGVSGAYNLSGTGQLSALNETIGHIANTGTLTQTTGTNTATRISIVTKGTYTLSGGTLNINGSLDNKGIWDLSNSTAVINMSSSIINLTGTIYTTSQNATLNIDSHSLLIVPSGHSASEYFATINNSGIVHQAGSPIDISPAYSIAGIGAIPDHVNCRGTLSAAAGNSITLNAGLTISVSGSVNLGNGTLTVKDAISGMDSGSLNAGNQYVDYNGKFAHTGGTNTVASQFYLGQNSTGYTPTYDLSGTGQLIAPIENIRLGTFTQTDGTNSVSSELHLGYDAGNGYYNLSGTGQLSAPVEYISYGSFGTFTQTGGTNSATYLSILTAGRYNLGAGTLNINGGLDNQGILDLSHSTATVNLSSAILSLSHIVYATAPNSTLNIDEHSLIVVPSGHTASEYFKTINNSGIVHQAGSQLDIPSPYSINGIATITDHVNCLGSLSATSGYAITLNGGLNVSGTGTVDLRTGNLYVNDLTSGMDGGSLYANSQYIGSTGTATFTHTGGTSSIASVLYLGSSSAASGHYYLSGSGQVFAPSEYVGDSGTGTFTQSGGANTTPYLVLGNNSGSSGTYYFDGGTLITRSISKGSGVAVFNFGGGTLQASGAFTCSMPMTLTGAGGIANIDTAGNAVTLTGALSGAGGLNKLGSGTLTLSGSNSYNGDTFISVGKLSLTATGSLSSSPIINVSSGATFDVSAKNSGNGGFTLASAQAIMGNGAINGNLVASSGSHIAPGTSAGTLTFTGNLTLNPGALLDFELASTSTSDKISMSNSTLYINNLDLSAFTFTALTGFGPGVYTLIDDKTISGNLGSILTGMIGDYPITLSKSNNDIILTVVPEPGTWLLMATACLGFLAKMMLTGKRSQI
jgi:fibronectin-binding autotransporter adhesin